MWNGPTATPRHTRPPITGQVLVVVSIAAIVEHRGRLSADPFLPSHIHHGLSGLAAGFPLAVYLHRLGEFGGAGRGDGESATQRRPRRVLLHRDHDRQLHPLLLRHGDRLRLRRGSAWRGPHLIIDVAHDTLGALAFLAYVGGLTSTLGVLIAGINSQASLVFNAGREGLLPSLFGYVHPTRRTPTNAIVTFTATTLVIIGGWGLGHVLGADGGSMNPVVFFTESSSLGATCFCWCTSCPTSPCRCTTAGTVRRSSGWVRHLVLPAIGVLAILVPLYYLAKSGQPAPYNWFPYAALATLLAAIGYATLLVSRDPTLAERVGSVVADAE